MSVRRPTFQTKAIGLEHGKPCARCYTPMLRHKHGSWSCENPNCSGYGKVLRP